MTKRLHLLSAIFLTCTATSFASDPEARVTGIEDADTLVVEQQGKTVRIQLRGIDAPEDTQNPKLLSDMNKTGLTADQLLPLGQASTAELKALLPVGSRIQLKDAAAESDRYGRLPARVTLADGSDLSATLVSRGYAVYLADKSDTVFATTLQQHEQQAREAGNGLWSDAFKSAMQPWDQLTRAH